MIPKLFTKNTLHYSLIVLVLLLFTSNEQAELFIMVLGIYLVFLFVKRDDFIIVLYIIILPTNGFIDRSYYLGGILGIEQLCSIFATMHILFNFPKRDKLSVNDYSKYAQNIVIVFFLYLLYTTIKDYAFDLNYLALSDVLSRVINIFILYIPLILILKRSADYRMVEKIQYGLLLGFINLAIFAFLSPSLTTLGIHSTGISESFAIQSDISYRYYGIMGDGDANSLGGFFAIGLGYYFAITKKTDSKFLLLLLIIPGSIVIALTGSRSAFIAFIMMLSILFLTKSQTGVFVKFFFLIIVIFISYSFWELVLTRISNITVELNTDTTGNRIGKWLFYFQHFQKNPSVYLFGTQELIFAGFDDTFLVSHNLYIQIIYNSGLFLVFALIFYYTKLMNLAREHRDLSKLLLFFIPFLIITISVADIGTVYYTLLYISLFTK